MAFCGNCGQPIEASSKFCTSCGSATSSTGAVGVGGGSVSPAGAAAGRMRPFGIALFCIAGFYLLMAIQRYNSAASQLLRLFGGTDSVVMMQFLYGLAAGIVGVLLFTSEPRAFLSLNRSGLIAFCILMGLLPILFWVPWLIPALRENRA